MMGRRMEKDTQIFFFFFLCVFWSRDIFTSSNSLSGGLYAHGKCSERTTKTREEERPMNGQGKLIGGHFLNPLKFHIISQPVFSHYPFVNSVAALPAAPNGKLDSSAIGWANRPSPNSHQPMLRENVLCQARRDSQRK